MDVLIKLVGVIGGVMVVKGLFGIVTGLSDFQSGKKNDNPTKMDNGIESMVWGGVIAGISSGIVATVIVAIQRINW